MIRINPLRTAFERGRRQGREESVEFLLQQASLHRGQVGDQRRRAALNVAATRIAQGKPPARAGDPSP